MRLFVIALFVLQPMAADVARAQVGMVKRSWVDDTRVVDRTAHAAVSG